MELRVEKSHLYEEFLIIFLVTHYFFALIEIGTS